MKYRIIRIITVLVILNIVCSPFLYNERWLIYGDEQDALVFFDITGEDSGRVDGDAAQLLILYYFGGLACALFIFVNALRKRSGACTFGSLVGSVLYLYLFYQFYSGTYTWYLHLYEAYLGFGFYISWVGFTAVFITSEF